MNILFCLPKSDFTEKVVITNDRTDTVSQTVFCHVVPRIGESVSLTLERPIGGSRRKTKVYLRGEVTEITHYPQENRVFINLRRKH